MGTYSIKPGQILNGSLFKSAPLLQNPVKDPVRFEWHKVKKAEHYYLSVDAVTKPMEIRENPAQFGDREK